MSVYRYRTWGGETATVDAASVEFTSEHVVWRDASGRVVLAESNNNVSRLSNDAAIGEATRRLETPEETTP